MYKKKPIYCNNCDKIGHEYKKCPQPITSWGIILIKINKDIDLKHDSANIKTKSHSIKPRDYKDLEMISLFMSTISFLMVQRKHSLGYIEFIRGRYKADNVDGINFLFQQMVPEEIADIASKSFDDLWREMWNNDEQKIMYYKDEYELSKEKFNRLKECKDVDLPLEFYTSNIKSIYKTQEWGFPKGRRTKGETFEECAIREFSEETGIERTNIKIVEEIEPIEENLIGTNGVKYRHIYYVAELTSDIKLNISGNPEIGDISFFTYNDALLAIREYHLDKRSILTNLYMHYTEMYRKFIE